MKLCGLRFILSFILRRALRRPEGPSRNARLEGRHRCRPALPPGQKVGKFPIESVFAHSRKACFQRFQRVRAAGRKKKQKKDQSVYTDALRAGPAQTLVQPSEQAPRRRPQRLRPVRPVTPMSGASGASGPVLSEVEGRPPARSAVRSRGEGSAAPSGRARLRSAVPAPSRRRGRLRVQAGCWSERWCGAAGRPPGPPGLLRSRPAGRSSRPSAAGRFPRR